VEEYRRKAVEEAAEWQEQQKRDFVEHVAELEERFDEALQGQAQAQKDENDRIVNKLQSDLAARDAELRRLRGHMPQTVYRDPRGLRLFE